MDVELMEKELSIMIENSAESNAYNQQVIDRQVEDLATAIKLTLGCMNDEFENNEEENLVEANRQLKTLLLESSNKILEFKDVINKQEQNLMKVANDFACKNEELTECLATVEELKRQIADREATKATNLPNVQNILMPRTDGAVIAGMEQEQEIFESEINLADSPQNSDEEDGPEIDVLENIFEKSCSEHEFRMTQISEERKHVSKTRSDVTRAVKPHLSNIPKVIHGHFKTDAESLESADVLSRLSDKVERMSNYITDLESKNNEQKSQRKLKSVTGSQNEKTNDPDNERDICESPDTIRPELNTDRDFENLQHRLTDMNSEIENLRKANEELKDTIRMLQQPISLKQSPSKSQSQLLNEAHREKLSIIRKSESTKETENQNAKLKLENAGLVSELNELKNLENQAQRTILEMQKELEKVEDQQAGNYIQQLDEMPPELKDLVQKYAVQKSATKEMSESKRNSSIGEQELGDDILGKIITTFPASAGKTDNLLNEIDQLKSENIKLKNELADALSNQQTKTLTSNRSKLSTKAQQSADTNKVADENAKMKLENERLIAELDGLKISESRAHLNLTQMEKDLEKLKSINEKLLAEIKNKATEKYEFPGKGTDSKNSILINEEPNADNEQILRKISYGERIGHRASVSNENQTNNESVFLAKNKDLSAEIEKLLSENSRLQKVNEELSRNAKNQLLNQTHLGRLSTKSQQFESDLISSDVKKIENENENLKLENEKLVAEIGKLKNSENCSHMNVLEMEKELQKLTSLNEELSAELNAKRLEKDLVLAKELGALPPNLKDLTLKNEQLRNDNEQLMFKIRCLERIDSTKDLSAHNKEMEKPVTSSENKTEEDWLPSNEDLVAEIEKLQQTKNKSNLAIRQMEKDLKKLESLNEKLLVQLSDKEAELKQFSMPPDVEQIHRQNEELKTLNTNLSVEISALKDSENLARSNEADAKLELANLAAVNRTLLAELNELKQTFNINNETLHKYNVPGHTTEKGELISPERSSHISILQIGKDLERLAALNESLLALNDTDTDKKHSFMEGMAPDINQLLKKNQELKNANENLSAKIGELQNTENRAHSEAIESKNRLETLAVANERLQAQIKELERSSNEHRLVPSLQTLKNENENLKATNNNLISQIAFLEEKLKNIENRTATYLKTSSSSNEQPLIKETTTSSVPIQPGNDYKMEIDWMVADMKKLQSKNETLRATNEKLLSQISDLQSCANRSNLMDETKNDSETAGAVKKESDSELIYANNRNIEIEWMKADMDVLQKKNEKLKSTNESLVAEIGSLKSAESRTHKSIQQMERDLLRLSAMNERLSSQLTEKRLDKKQLSRVQANDPAAPDSKELLNKIQELTNSNESLVTEITELKSLDIVKMRNDLKKLSSTNESLKMQISELKLLSSNDLKMESDWMAADMKKLLNKNKKLNISNQNLLNEINEMRREFRSLENRANANALQKVKELERLMALNENLKEQLNFQANDKKASKSHDIGLDGSAPDAKKLQKKNEELKAANEKLLSVILNLKNSEKQATCRAAELEKELTKLQDINNNLQDTIENYVEKDWSKPKTELERICQLILNEGICALTDTEYHYMYKWFCKSSSTIDFDVPKTTRRNTTRKHCRICHQAVDSYDKICDCKQYEGQFYYCVLGH